MAVSRFRGGRQLVTQAQKNTSAGGGGQLLLEATTTALAEERRLCAKPFVPLRHGTDETWRSPVTTALK